MTRTAKCRNTQGRQQCRRPGGPIRLPLAPANASTPMGPHVTAFFEQRLPIERGASEHTRDSYAYAFQLLLTFASKRLAVTPSQLAVEQIDARW